MRSIGVFLLSMGISFFIMGVLRDNMIKNQENITKVEYRYIPRTFIEAQNEPVPVSEIFQDMFEKQSPFIRDFGSEFGIDRRGNENAYNITQ